MSYTAEELKNVALLNKSRLRKKSFNIPVADEMYIFKISGIGQMSIKLEQFFNYSQIISAVQKGNKGFEFLIEQIIIDPNKEKTPNLDDSRELRERAFANKQALKRMNVNVFIGVKEYDFRIAGIGGRAIKLESYVGYEDIAKELNKGNEATLEFILKEILIENEVDYSIFEDVEIEDAYEDDDYEDDEVISVTKLTSEESNMLISKISGVHKLVFDAIDSIDSDIFTIGDVLEQDILKIYSVEGNEFRQTIKENIQYLCELGIITDDGENYFKLW